MLLGLQNPTLAAIAKAHNKSIQHTIIRWGVQHGTSVLPKSSNPGRIKVGSRRMHFGLCNPELGLKLPLEAHAKGLFLTHGPAAAKYLLMLFPYGP